MLKISASTPARPLEQLYHYLEPIKIMNEPATPISALTSARLAEILIRSGSLAGNHGHPKLPVRAQRGHEERWQVKMEILSAKIKKEKRKKEKKKQDRHLMRSHGLRRN
jgi:hypothetical protein